MQTKIITSFFTRNSNPATGLSPTIRIWTITDGTQSLVITNEPMIEVGDGFYKYIFTDYDSAFDYAIRTDGGATLRTAERYQVSSNESFADDVALSVWNERKIDYLTPGSFGEAINTIDANTDALRLDVTAMYNLIQLLVKYESNRTQVDKTAKTLTVFDNDGVTPLQIFNLFDSLGNASVDEVCERVPA